MATKHKKQNNDDKDKKKKKRILFAWLFGILGAGAIATAIAVPLVLLNKNTHEPIVGPTFSVADSTMKSTTVDVIELDWTPQEDSITFDNDSFKFIYGDGAEAQVSAIPGPATRPFSLELTFAQAVTSDITDGKLSFHFEDKTSRISGDYEVANIHINKYVQKISFEVETGAAMWDPIYTTLKLDWTPQDHEIEFSDITFKYNSGVKEAEYIDIVESTIGSISLQLTFSEIIYESDISDGVLSFNYNDKTLGQTGSKSIENINIAKYVIPELIFRIDKKGEDQVIITGFKDDLQEKPADLVIPSYIYATFGPETKFFKVGEINSEAFSGDMVIKTLTIPNTMTVLSENAFKGCEELTKIIFAAHSQATSISESCFDGCWQLESVNLPESITSIGTTAFNICTSLTSVNFDGTIAQWNAISFGVNCWDGVATDVVHCIDGDTPLIPVEPVDIDENYNKEWSYGKICYLTNQGFTIKKDTQINLTCKMSEVLPEFYADENVIANYVVMIASEEIAPEFYNECELYIDDDLIDPSHYIFNPQASGEGAPNLSWEVTVDNPLPTTFDYETSVFKVVLKTNANISPDVMFITGLEFMDSKLE